MSQEIESQPAKPKASVEARKLTADLMFGPRLIAILRVAVEGGLVFAVGLLSQTPFVGEGDLSVWLELEFSIVGVLRLILLAVVFSSAGYLSARLKRENRFAHSAAITAVVMGAVLVSGSLLGVSTYSVIVVMALSFVSLYWGYRASFS